MVPWAARYPRAQTTQRPSSRSTEPRTWLRARVPAARSSSSSTPRAAWQDDDLHQSGARRCRSTRSSASCSLTATRSRAMWPPSLGLERSPHACRRLARRREERDREETIEEISTVHSSGLSILVLASSPLHTEILEPKRVADAIIGARDDYDWVILDMHPDYGPLNQALFEQADRILIPVTPDVPCIRAAIQFREVAIELDIRDRLSVVINRANSGVAAADVQRVVDLRTSPVSDRPECSSSAPPTKESPRWSASPRPRWSRI